MNCSVNVHSSCEREPVATTRGPARIVYVGELPNFVKDLIVSTGGK